MCRWLNQDRDRKEALPLVNNNGSIPYGRGSVAKTGQLVAKSDSGALHASCQAPFQSWNCVESALNAPCLSGSGIALATDQFTG